MQDKMLGGSLRPKKVQAHERIEQLKHACAELSAALSRIDYIACGEDNEMGVSSYDLHCDPEIVVRHVKEAIKRTPSPVYVGKLAPSAALRMTLDVLKQGGSLETYIAGNGTTLRQVIEKALERPFREESSTKK